MLQCQCFYLLALTTKNALLEETQRDPCPREDIRKGSKVGGFLNRGVVLLYLINNTLNGLSFSVRNLSYSSWEGFKRKRQEIFEGGKRADCSSSSYQLKLCSLRSNRETPGNYTGRECLSLGSQVPTEPLVRKISTHRRHLFLMFLKWEGWMTDRKRSLGSLLRHHGKLLGGCPSGTWNRPSDVGNS
ncbi:hypothetical protein NPIL_280931 [Nephila pilipes]|uniref:Uncharacterized protein n=1 Tax=Nephila pilipes TaxID=299642 RepID=A0A8X6MCQ9_NEPPI|nr:hypothetical protein NPIL_280931 [Nephila pilipes]